MKLLVSPLSPYARKCRVLVREAGREGEVEEVMVSTTPAAPDAGLVAVNPAGRIPALVRDDGPPLSESLLICRYLDARWDAGLYPEARLWEVLRLEGLAEGVLDAALLMAYEARLRPEAHRWPQWIEDQWAKAARTLDLLESEGLPGDGFDMGQAALACALGYVDLRHGARDWRAGRPRLAAWEARVAARPSLAATRPPGG